MNAIDIAQQKKDQYYKDLQNLSGQLAKKLNELGEYNYFNHGHYHSYNIILFNKCHLIFHVYNHIITVSYGVVHGKKIDIKDFDIQVGNILAELII